MCRRDAYKFNIFTYMYVRSCCRINTLFTEYRETSLVWCRIVTRAYDTRDKTRDLSLYSVNNIYLTPYSACTSPENTQKRMGFYMEVIILGVVI